MIKKFKRCGSIAKLAAYDWPGNIRELKNIVERAIILSGSHQAIRHDNLAFCASQLETPSAFSSSFEHEPTLEEMEEKYLTLFLERHSGHRTKIARSLGISERSVYRMVEKYDVKQG